MPSYNKPWYVMLCKSNLRNQDSKGMNCTKGMYPTAIVVLVEMQISLYDTEEVTRERVLTIANCDIIFASRELETVRGGHSLSPPPINA